MTWSNGKCKTDVVASTKKDLTFMLQFSMMVCHTLLMFQEVFASTLNVYKFGCLHYSIDGTANESVTLVCNARFWNDIATEATTQQKVSRLLEPGQEATSQDLILLLFLRYYRHWRSRFWCCS